MRVPAGHVVTLRMMVTHLKQEYRPTPDIELFERGKWHAWVTPRFLHLEPSSDQAPWYFLGAYKGIDGKSGMDRQVITTVVPTAQGYHQALEAARKRSNIGVDHLVDGILVYCVYFDEQREKVRDPSILNRFSRVLTWVIVEGQGKGSCVRGW
jgi:hypothetical protein